ncbi:MAG: PadR family transcriptional regulator [Bryobacterales bacterium]|nr:PadR family transcriptional regulator [Bryobacterales bacterium]
MAPARRSNEIPPGTLSMLILTMLDRHGELHGFEIASHIEAVSEEVLRVEEGSLYPALQRLLREGLVAAEWGVTKANRRARYYQLTAEGRERLAEETQQYERVTGAIFRILNLPEASQA